VSSSKRMKTTKELKTQARFTGDGVLIVDKPAGFTSHDVVQKVKRKLGAAKVGHSGTLDPFATGVLILLINGATKLAPFLADHEKTYLFNVSFGVETDTQDSTGKVVARQPCEPIQEREIRAACDAFIGEIEQTVPRYSAVRVKGQRLYQLARRGVEVTPPNRKVKIKDLSFCELRWPEATFEVTCSKGTYVRSLGVDLAHHLNCNGHVSQLRRLASGGFDLRQAVTLEQLEESMARGDLHQLLMTSAQALDCYPELRVSPLDAKRIRQGSTLDSIQFLDPGSSPGWPAGSYKVLDPDNNLVAMVSKAAKVANDRQEGGVTFKTLRVFGAV
jgi:tRNA pseudouridine55 synthase